MAPPKNARLDEEVEESFPASDPPSITQPAIPEAAAPEAPAPEDGYMHYHGRRRDRTIGMAILVGVFALAWGLQRER